MFKIDKIIFIYSILFCSICLSAQSPIYIENINIAKKMSKMSVDEINLALDIYGIDDRYPFRDGGFITGKDEYGFLITIILNNDNPKYFKINRYWPHVSFYIKNGNVISKRDLCNSYETINGVIHGVEKQFNKDGKLKRKRHWKMGKLDGVDEEFNSRGKVISRIIWKDDKFVETSR